MLSAVRIQEKGQVTIPRDIRKRLRLKKGDLVTFIVQENNVVLKPVDAALRELFNRLEVGFEPRGVSLEDVLASCRQVGGEIAARQYGLSAEEKETLFLALQLQAQQALETIRLEARAAGLDQLTDQKIDAEIKAARDEAASSHRS